MKIADYNILEQLEENRDAIIYRACNSFQENQTVKIKVLKTEYPKLSEMIRFKQEYELVKSLNHPGIIKIFQIIQHIDTIALVMEDFPGLSLTQVIDIDKLKLKQFFKIAIQLAETLGFLHENNLSHRNLCPSSILFHKQTNQVKITNFGVIYNLNHTINDIYHPQVIQNLLPYISPEQTGRMNRIIDYRSDLYSLGILFYKMVTGSLPFISEDPLEIIHFHIARIPESPSVLKPKIPEMLSQIILKLLAKTAEERYQNSFGVMFDLKKCQADFENNKTISTFPLASRDISFRYNIPQRLFGRKKELEILLQAVKRIYNGNKETILVTGVPGIGKSAVVNEINRVVIEKNGYFITGKYEQYRREVPYSAIIQALQSLIRQILSCSKSQIDFWKNHILNCIGGKGQILIDVLPNLELIIGRQQSLNQLGLEETQNRFNYIFAKFIKIFCKPEHPLVLFLDDLQWADSSSLLFIKKFLEDPDLKYFLFIGAYRINEIAYSQSVMRIIEDILKNQHHITEIKLNSLDISDINDFITNFLRSSPEKTKELSEMIQKKTNGNPFFINQFVKTLYDKNFLNLDPEIGWKWNLNRIAEVEITENVVDLMINKISELNPQIREILMICSCIGNRFDLEILSKIIDKPIEYVLADIAEAIEEGLIGVSAVDEYVFQHDRIQEAAYSLISSEKKIDYHIRIGKLLLEKVKPQELRDKIFYIVNQLNHSIKIITDPEEKVNLAQLNLIAGNKARESSAYSSALNYLKIGIELLGPNCWKDMEDLTIAFYNEAIKAAFLKYDFKEMNTLADTALPYIKKPEDKVEINIILIHALIAQKRYQEAILICIKSINAFGMKIPTSVNKFQIAFILIKLKHLLKKKKSRDFMNRSLITDYYLLAVLRLLSAVMIQIYLKAQDLIPIICYKLLSIYLKDDNAPQTNLLNLVYGIIYCHYLNNVNEGYKLGQTAFSLSNKLKSEFHCRMIFIYNVMIRHLKEPYKNITESLLENFQNGLETGELDSAAISLFYHSLFSFSLGIELSTLLKLMENNVLNFNQVRQNEALFFQLLWLQGVMNLLGKAKDPYQLTGDAINEDSFIIQLQNQENPILLAHFHFIKLFLVFLLNNRHDLAEKLNDLNPHLKSMKGMFLEIQVLFFVALAYLKLFPVSTKKQQAVYLKHLNKYRSIMKKYANDAPMNHLHKYYLLEAEMARINKDKIKAVSYYDQALKTAHQNQLIPEEAICYECAGQYYLELGHFQVAEIYIMEAYQIYQKWGATVKVKEIEATYQNMFVKQESIFLSSSWLNDKYVFHSSEGPIEKLDISTVIKFSQAIAGEIDLVKLLEKIIMISLENAGAQKGVLLLVNEKDENLYIEALGTVEKNVILLPSLPYEISDDLSISIINYVNKTRENIILNNAAEEGFFINDPYIKKNKIRSVLCVPIIHKNRLNGILYLENNLIDSAFSIERLELLNILASQIAISIENALLLTLRENLLYKLEQQNQELEKNVAERTEKLRLAIEETNRANKAKSVFLASMSHEIRTPLNSVMGFIDLLEKTNLDRTQREYIEILQKSTHSLLGIINNILDFSKIESGKMELEYQEFNPLYEFKSVIELFTARASEKSLDLLVYISPRLPQWIKGDLLRIKQVLINLLSNAVKFTNRDGIVTLEVRPVQINDTVCRISFSVADTGVGIKKEQQKKIFEPYEQMDSSIFRKYGGTGLGLSISTNLIKLMGGELHLFSEEGKGSRFSFEIDFPQVQTNMNETNAFKMINSRMALWQLKEKLTQQEEMLLQYFSEYDKKITIFKQFEQITKIDLVFLVYDALLENQIVDFYLKSPGLIKIMIAKESDKRAIHEHQELFTYIIYQPIYIMKIIDLINIINSTDHPIITNSINDINFEPYHIKILVAEDDEISQQLIKILLNDMGINVDLAFNGNEVVNLYRMNSYHLILMDVYMPECNGVEAAQQILTIEAAENKRHVPIIALTANAMKGDKEQILAAGIDDYLTKPIQINELKGVLMNYLKFGKSVDC